MDLTFSDEQRQLADAAQAFIARDWTIETVRELEHQATGFSPRLWKSMCALGWPGLAIGEADGGLGGELGHLVVVLDRLGSAAATSPLPYSVAMGAFPLARASQSRVRERLLPGIADGSVIATAAVAEPDGCTSWPATEAPSSGTGWRLTATKTLVPFATAADVLIVPTVLAGKAEALVVVSTDAAGIRCRPMATFAGQPTFEVIFTGVEIGPDDVIATGEAARTLLSDADAVLAVVLGALTVGLCSGALRVAVRYAGERIQFGQPIGAFQTVANRLVDARSAIDASHLLTHRAAWALDTGAADAEMRIAIMKVTAAQMIQTVVANTHQTLGAIGFTMEHDLQLYTRRLKALEVALGRRTGELETIASALGLAGENTEEQKEQNR